MNLKNIVRKLRKIAPCHSFAILALCLLAPLQLSGQSGAGLLAPNRYIDWSNAGATITNRTTQCGSTIAAGASAATIQAALSSCAGTGQYVLLGSGTFNLSSSIVTTASNVTLRGSGPTHTILEFSATSSSGIGTGATAIYISNGDSHQIGNTSNVLLVSSGLTQGATSVVLGGVPSGTACGSQGATPITCSGSISNLHVGSILIFNQQDDATDTGNTIWNGTNFSQQSSNGSNFRDRSEIQGVTVTGISGSTVTFTPAIYAPNWSMAKTPYATFSSTLPVTGFGLEDLTVDTSSAATSGQAAAIQFGWSKGSWVKNVSIINSTVAGASFQNHVWITSSLNDTVEDTYMYGSSPTSGGYGIQMWQTGDSLSQNNICQHIATCQIQDGGAGNVWAYAYAVDNAYTNPASWQQCDIFHHSAGDGYSLFEGNIGICATLDDIHGTGNFITLFRNSLSGFDPNSTAKTLNLLTINNMAYARYNNFVANVLGYGGHATTYQYVMSSTTDCGSGNNGWVYALGDAIQNMSTCSPTPPNDVTANAAPQFSDVRWGNYDGVTGTVRTNSGETASTASTYPGLVSPSTTWASYPSLYLASKPSWFGSIAWPGIGPEITGGNISSTGGHANLNPAANCYLNILHGAVNGSSGPLPFDAASCYPTASAAAPTFSPLPGAYGSTQSVTLATTTSGAAICFTIDGSTPTASSGSCTHGTAYSAPVSVAVTTTFRAIASAVGLANSVESGATYTINSSAAAPTFSPVAGSYGPTQSVSLTTSTTGATICYTVDGSTPTANGAGTCTHGTTYSTAISVSSSQTVKAIASKSGWNDSSVSSAAYVINGAASTPTFSPVAGTYSATQAVTISTSTGGATICYTTNGSSPASSSPGVCAVGSTQYVSAVTVASSQTLKAIATEAGWSDSSIGSAAYVITGSVATPTFSPSAGTYANTQSVTITSSPGATICYTTDGTTPTGNGAGTCTHGTTYSTPVSVASALTLEAIGTQSGSADSSVGSAAYAFQVATPTFSPGAGTYTSTQTVTISTATSGATLRYTTTGTAPTCSTGTVYSAPVSVATSETLKAIGCLAGYTDSSVGSAAYVINISSSVSISGNGVKISGTVGIQ